MKRLLFAFTFTVIFLIPCLGFAVPADVEKLSSSDYFPAVDKALNEAKKSIFLVMYYVEYRKEKVRDKTQEEGKVVALLDDLVKAKERGIKVTVVLDRNTVFSPREARISGIFSGSAKGGKNNKIYGKRMEIDGKNMPAFYFLKRHGVDPIRSNPLQAADAVPLAEQTSNGVNVKFDTLDVYTHGKCIVIDGETVILGSHNWTKNSLTRSNEYSVLIKDKELAQELIKYFSKIQIDYEASKKEAEEYVVLSKDVLVNVLSGFVSNSNNYCWDVYMYLIGYSKECQAQGPPTPDMVFYFAKATKDRSEDIAYKYDNKVLNFDYKKVAQYLGLDKKMSEEDYREILGYQTLKELQDKYGLLEYTPVKKQVVAGITEIFSGKHQRENEESREEAEELYKQIGKLKVENDFLKKTLYQT